jgi:purine-cytosine permease-like protein
MNFEPDEHHKNFLFHFAYMWSGFTMLYIAGVTFVPVPERNQHVVDTAEGFLLGTIVAGFIGYFYGSSHGSKDKDATLKEVVEDNLMKGDQDAN